MTETQSALDATASWSPQQELALSAVESWMKSGPGKNGVPQIFRLFGFAGTGKTTLAKELAQWAKGTVLFATFTGKAALVLQSKGCWEREHDPQPDLQAEAGSDHRRI
jgi:hypothetical protein